LGLEFARQYANDGWSVFASCRHPHSATALQELVKTASVRIIRLDVTDKTSIEEASGQIEGPIDVLINCAGHQGMQPDAKNRHLEVEPVPAL
jgi:NAD(P)-dependent dehydrogenase (short-subunit alcohol dehydrogenase family)